MTDKERILITGVVDEVLCTELDTREQFNEEERERIEERYLEIFDTTSPKDIRESMATLARKLYEETFDKEGD